MLQKILLLMTTSLLLSLNVVAQDVSVDVTDILYDENGSLIDPAKVRLNFEMNVLPVRVVYVDPCGNDYDYLEINSITYNNFCLEPGEWCFALTTNPDTPEACTIDFCVDICECRLVERHGEILVRSCGKCDEKPNDDNIPAGYSMQNVNTDELFIETPDKLEIEKSAIIAEDEIQAFNSNFTLNKVFPNPFSNQITIELDANEKIDFTINMFDVLGKKILSQNFSSNQGENYLVINPDINLSAGTYLIQIQGDNGQIEVETVVKQK